MSLLDELRKLADKNPVIRTGESLLNALRNKQTFPSVTPPQKTQQSPAPNQSKLPVSKNTPTPVLQTNKPSVLDIGAPMPKLPGIQPTATTPVTEQQKQQATKAGLSFRGGNKETYFDPVPDKVRIRDVVREIPAATATTVKDIAQATARGFAGVGVGATDIFRKEKVGSIEAPDISDPSYIAALNRTIFGEQPIKTPSTVAAELEQRFKGVNNSILQKTALPLAVVGSVGSSFLDIYPGGGGTKQIYKNLAKETSEVVVKDILKSLNVTDDVITKLAPLIVKESSEKGVKQILKNVKITVPKQLAIPKEKSVVHPKIVQAIPENDPLRRLLTVEDNKGVQSVLQRSSKFSDANDAYLNIKEHYTDELTGLLGQKFYKQTGMEKAPQLFLDVDNFGKFNTDYSQTTGDKVLSTFGQLIDKHFPNKGVRAGGEEFVLDTSGISRDDLLRRLQGLREDLMNQSFVGEGGPKSGQTVTGINFTSAFGKDATEASSAMKAQKAAQRGVDNIDNTLYNQYNNIYEKQGIQAQRETKIPSGQSTARFEAGTAPAVQGLSRGESAIGEGIRSVEGKSQVVPQRFRSDKLNLSEQDTQKIVDRLQALGLDTRSVRSFDEMKKIAEDLGTSPSALLKDIRSGRINDSEVISLRNMINQNSQFISRAEKQIADDPRLALTLNPQIKLAQDQIDQALKKLVKGGTEAGRTVAAYRIMANNTLDPSYWLMKAQKELGDRVLTEEMQGIINDLIGKYDINGLAVFIASLKKAPWTTKAVTLWKAGLLTAPTTHFANIFGNITSLGLANASNVASTGIDILASLVTKKRTTTFSRNILKTELKSLTSGIKKAGSFFKTGQYSSNLTHKWELPHEVNFENKILKGYTNAVFRSLGAEDIIFREAAMQKSLAKQAEVLAKNAKLKGQAFKDEVKKLMTQPTNDMVVQAINDAEYATFQNKTALGEMISGAKNRVKGKSPVAEVGIEIIAPFTQTPTSIADRLISYSPAGFIKAAWKAVKPSTRDQKAIVEDLGRAVTGTGIIALGAALASKGLMTGTVPTNPKEKEQFYAEGKQPNSILINGYWFNLNRISPLGNLLGIGADFQNLSKTEEGLGLYEKTAGNALKSLTDMSFLQGLSGGLKALTEPNKSLKGFVASSVASIVPTIVSKIARTIDPRLRNPEGVLETTLSRIPGAAETVPLRKDIFGQDVKTGGGRFVLFDPFTTTKANNDPLLKEMDRIGVSVGLPGNEAGGITLNKKEYESFQKVNGTVLKEVLDTMIQTKEYQSLPDTKKQDAMETVIAKVRSQVRDSYIPHVIIQRYELPVDTSPELISTIVDKLGKNKTYKDLPPSKKEAMLKKVVTSIVNNPPAQ